MQDFQKIFMKEKKTYFDFNFTEGSIVYSQVSVGSGNGLEPNRWQTIFTQTNND